MKIIWTDESLKNIEAIVNYLNKKWGEKVTNEFLVKLRERSILISKLPAAFTLINKEEQIRSSVLTKQTTIFFRVDYEAREIKILSVFDTRQDPDKLKL